MDCRKCGACCIAPSISSYIPNMGKGKAKNTKCVNLDENMLCKLFYHKERPKVCVEYKPDEQFCQENFEETIKILNSLE